jgi:hypothetical protein
MEQLVVRSRGNGRVIDIMLKYLLNFRCKALDHAGRLLLAAIIVDGRNVLLDVYSVMQDARDLDRPFCSNPVHQEVASATAVSRNMERAQARHDPISGARPRNIGTVGEFTDRLNECVPIDSGLPRAEIFSGPFEDICEIKLCGSANANAPFAFDHKAPILLLSK